MTSQGNSLSNWILGVVVFFLCVNSAYALIGLVIVGFQAEINILYLVGGTYYMPMYLYFFISAWAAAVSFSYLVFSRNSGVQIDADAVAGSVEDMLQNDRLKLEKEVRDKFAKLSLGQFGYATSLKNIKMLIEENVKRMERLAEVEDKYAKSVEKQLIEIETLKKKIEKMEHELKPKPRLNSNSDIQEIDGVGEKTAEKFRSVGINKVQDLITEPSSTLAQTTGLSKNKIEKIKAVTHLLMVPGINEKNVKLLQKAGIKSVSKLANQSPIKLFKKIATIKNGENKPSLEEVASYITLARSNLNLYGD